MTRLAWRNLFHDRVKLAVTLTGIVFAVVLIAVQVGLFLGFATTTSTVIDHSGADIWVVPKGVANIDRGGKMPERKRYDILAEPDVAHADRYLVDFVAWQRADGGREPVLVVGYDPDTGLGGPWDIVAGRAQDLRAADAVAIDEFYRDKLGVTHLGQVAEINGRRARVVAFTRGIRSFTTSPFVFTWFKNAQQYRDLRADETGYIVVKTKPGANLDDLKARLKARISGVEVYTTAEFSRSTQLFWMFGTGAGVALIIAAFLGLVVGVVVVSQTTYAMTMDRIREFGTLKAMGATNGYISGVIVVQALTSAAMGYGIGIAIAAVVTAVSQGSAALILLPWQLAAALLVLALGMCVLASLASIRKVATLDPVMVFKE